MESLLLDSLVKHLFTHVSENKQKKIPEVLAHKTERLTIVLEDISDPHNASAVLRTAEAVGLTDVSIIEHQYRYTKSETIDKGSGQWLNLNRFGTPQDCLEKLREQGYTIVATTPHPQGYLLDQLPIEGKTALVFGTERLGISPYIIEHADAYVSIPMYGFTESYNISVAAGICLHTLIQKIRTDSPENWQLSPDQSNRIALAWLRRLVSGSTEIERRFLLGLHTMPL